MGQKPSGCSLSVLGRHHLKTQMLGHYLRSLLFLNLCCIFAHLGFIYFFLEL